MNTVHRSTRLLFVDSDVSLLNGLRQMFQGPGVEVSIATSGEEALAAMRQQPADVVVSDYLLAGIDGVELLELLRDRHPDSQRVLYTGQADMRSTTGAINRAEVFRLVLKPASEVELKDVVRSALAQQSLRRENRRLVALARQQERELRQRARPPAAKSGPLWDERGAYLLSVEDDADGTRDDAARPPLC